MSYIERAMKDAADHGWDRNQAQCQCGCEEIDHALMRKDFWQFLGKALHWGNGEPVKQPESALSLPYPSRMNTQEWRTRWFMLSFHIADGGTTETYFKKLYEGTRA